MLYTKYSIIYINRKTKPFCCLVALLATSPQAIVRPLRQPCPKPHPPRSSGLEVTSICSCTCNLVLLIVHKALDHNAVNSRHLRWGVLVGVKLGGHWEYDSAPLTVSFRQLHQIPKHTYYLQSSLKLLSFFKGINSLFSDYCTGL